MYIPRRTNALSSTSARITELTELEHIFQEYVQKQQEPPPYDFIVSTGPRYYPYTIIAQLEYNSREGSDSTDTKLKEYAKRKFRSDEKSHIYVETCRPDKEITRLCVMILCESSASFKVHRMSFKAVGIFTSTGWHTVDDQEYFYKFKTKKPAKLPKEAI